MWNTLLDNHVSFNRLSISSRLSVRHVCQKSAQPVGNGYILIYFKLTSLQISFAGFPALQSVNVDGKLLTE